MLDKRKTAVIENVLHARDDYVRFDNEYDVWLLNSQWKIKPSITFINGIGPQIMCCRDHHGGCKKMFLHCPRQPNHILPSRYADQPCLAVIKPQTIAPMKANTFSNTFQMHEQKGTFD